MPDRPLSTIVRHLRRVAGVSGTADVTDRQLLERFATRRDEAAFAALAQRHGALVWGVCRRVLGHAQDAEDAFQATFLVLARKAATVRWQDSVAPWLYEVAYRLAAKAKAGAARRRELERRAAAIPRPEPRPEATWREVCELLDAELHGLSERYRAPLVLCYLEGQTRDQAAGQLGLSLRTLDRRLGRGREQLHARLTRRGLTLPAALLATAVGQQAASAAVPALLVSGGVRAAAGFATGNGTAGAIPARVAALTEGAVKGMALNPLKLVVALVVVASLAAGGTGLLALRAPAAKLPEAEQEARPKSPVASAAVPKSAVSQQGRTDRYGDPLPGGALARLGTVRLRHGSLVSAVAFSPDGKVVVSGGYDNRVRLWDVNTGMELPRFGGLNFGSRDLGQVWSIALSPDGRVLAVGGQDHFVQVFRLATGEAMGRLGFADGLGGFNSVAFSPDGRTLAGGSIVNKIGLWEVATGRLLHTLQGHGNRITCVAFSPDGRTLASASIDQTARLWDLQDGKELRRFVGHQGEVSTVAFSSDGKAVASGGKDNTVRLWDAATGRELRQVGKLLGWVRSVAFSPDGATLATGIRQTRDVSPEACATVLLDVATGKALPRLKGHGFSVESVAFSPGGPVLASGGGDSVVRLWDVTAASQLCQPGTPEFPVSAVALSPDRRTVASASYGAIHLWQADTGKELRRLEGHQGSVSCLAFAAGGATLISGGEDRTIRLWDVATGSQLRRLEGPQAGVACVALTADGKALASGSWDGTVCRWEVASGKELQKLHMEGAFIHALVFPASGSRVLAVAGDSKALSLWEFTHGKGPHRLIGPREWWNRAALSPDGRFLAWETSEGRLNLYDVARGKDLPGLAAPRPPLDALCFSPDGKTLASGSRGGLVRLWEVSTGKERAHYPGHRGQVCSLAFSLDGQVVASGSADTTVLVWDATGQARGGGLPRISLAPAEQEAAWADLAGGDAPAAYRAIWKLVATGRQTVLFLRERFHPATAADPQKISMLIQDLDSSRFARRGEASRQLEALGELAEPMLRKTLRGRPSLEVRRRVEQLLGQLESAAGSPQSLQALRAMEVLERIGSRDAREVLETLAGGEPEARLTQEAKASLERLARRPAGP